MELFNADIYTSTSAAALGFGFLTIPYNPRFKDWLPVVMRFRFLAPLAVLFGSSYLILIVVMWWPVYMFPDGSTMKVAFWVAPLAGSGVLIAGALYYLAYAALLPALGFGVAVSIDEYSDGKLVVTFKVSSIRFEPDRSACVLNLPLLACDLYEGYEIHKFLEREVVWIFVGVWVYGWRTTFDRNE